jgi:hypothetical protein
MLEFEDGSRLGEHCHDGRALILDLADDPELRALGAKWCDRLRVMSIRTKAALGLAAEFVRPDGCVAWASDARADLAEAANAMSMWLGNPD